MELTRRDAVAALAALGTTGGALGLSEYHDSESDPLSQTDERADQVSNDEVQAVMTSVASVVYPSEVDGVEQFVTAFLSGRLDDTGHGDGIREAVATLEDRARSWYDQSVTDLDQADREQLLGEVGADVAEEDPTGTPAEQIRYYVVNELLLALYTSPTGGELVGIENPQGHPGGTDTYQRGPR